MDVEVLRREGHDKTPRGLVAKFLVMGRSVLAWVDVGEDS